jgi:hypothetical protein
VVTHSEVVAAILGHARGRVPFVETMVGVRNASVTVVDLDRAGRYRIVAVDRAPLP